MPVKWTVEYDGDGRPGTARKHLQAILDLFSDGKARITCEEVTDQAEDAVEVPLRTLTLVGRAWGKSKADAAALRKDGGCVRAAKGSRRAAAGG